MVLLYVIPWICVVTAVVVTIGSAVLAGPRGPGIIAAVREAAGRAGARLRAAGARLEQRRRYRAFDRALADFRRNAAVCAADTLDDTVETTRE